MTKPYRIIHGDCFRLAKALPTASVHCIVTSPPYFGLRDYQTEPRVWGGDKHCSHRWGEKLPSTQRLRNEAAGGLHSGRRERKPLAGGVHVEMDNGEFCRRCGAWRGSFGQEPTPELYVQHLVKLFRQLWRVLRDDGTVWLNLGDSYWGGKGATTLSQDHHNVAAVKGQVRPQDRRHEVIKSKDLVGIPWRVAFALQAAGWYLRNDIIWHKPNPMPESVTDRCTRAHEYLFLLTKQPQYFYDAEAVKEPNSSPWQLAHNLRYRKHYSADEERSAHGQPGNVNSAGKHTRPGGVGRNRRSVWTITTQPYRAAHFAVYPEALVEPCIQAGTSEKGCCPKCGAPWTRVIAGGAQRAVHGESVLHTFQVPDRRTLKWVAGCKCGRKREPVPCTVLDPFNGSGTTGAVAVKLQRRYVGIELNPAYVTMAERRLRRAARTPQAQLSPLFARSEHA